MTWINKGRGDVYSVVCPYCKAPVGQPCVNLNKAAQGKKVWIMHKARKDVFAQLPKKEPAHANETKPT